MAAGRDISSLVGLPVYLEREFARRRAGNGRYSLRAFARDLGCDHSTLSQWMRGTRPLTRESVNQLCNALSLRGIDRRRACEIDEIDVLVMNAARDASCRTSAALAEAAGLSVDRTNMSLFKLMALKILKMEGADWRLVEKELA